MLKIKEYSDPQKCRELWEELWPKNCFFDQWEVRDSFRKTYNRPMKFLVAQQNGKNVGLLPLCAIDKENCFSFFPGETWNGKTWLEQNKIPFRDTNVRNELLAHASGTLDLRYLDPNYIVGNGVNFELDEIGYIFSPGQYDYSFGKFTEGFSRKFKKNYTQESKRLESYGLTFRHDHFPDLAQLFQMNLEAFGESSYFSDKRFLGSFETLTAWLWDREMLRITTVLIGGTVAAVDIGAVWDHTYTVLAGGTNPEFKGVAKIINFHHLERSCIERFNTVDFLCGDFGWKERFHLTARPLYKLHSDVAYSCINANHNTEAELSLVQ